jgi:hypothetical protein
VAKQLTADQVQARKDKAVRFAENVLEDDDLADDLDSESVESYAERKRIKIIPNTGRRNKAMAGNGNNGKTKQDLLDEIADLQDENDALQSQLDAVLDIVAPEDEDDDQNEDDDGN